MTVGLVSFSGYPPIFNGGKSQVNFNAPNGDSGEYPFLNVMKSGGTWTYITGGTGPVIPTDLDSNGYPTVINNGGVKMTCFVPSQTARPGNYMATWDGNGTLYCPSGTLVTGSFSTSGVVFSLASNQLSLGISAIGSPALTNLKVFHVNDQTAVAAGHVFSTQFKAMLSQARFGVYRFLNWQQGITSNVTTWATRKPIGYVTWGGQELRSSLWAGTTTNSGDDYSATFGSGAPADKTTVLCKFGASRSATAKTSVTFNVVPSTITWTAHGFSGNEPVGFGFNGGTVFPTPVTNSHNYYVLVVDANTIQISLTPGGAAVIFGGSQSGVLYGARQPTFSLNGTTAIPIKDMDGTTLGSGNSPLINSAAALTYDSGLGSWMLNGGSATFGDIYLQSGVPPEICVQLCAEMGTHPHFVQTNYAADPITDFSASLATYIKTSGPSWMIPRFECLNEAFNPVAHQFVYCLSKAQSYGWGADYYNAYGKMLSLLGQAINGVYGGTPSSQTKYQVLCGVQTATFSSGTNATKDPLLKSTLYVSQQSGSAASNWATHVTCFNYIRGTAYPSAVHSAATEAGYLSTWLTNGSLANDAVLTTYVDTLSGATDSNENLAALKDQYIWILAWANNASGGTGGTGGLVHKMCGYEGGYSPDYITSGVTTSITSGSISSTTLTTSGGNPAIGMVVTGGTTAANTVILSGSGTTWTVNNSQTVASTAMTGSYAPVNLFRAATKLVADVGVAINGGTMVNGQTVAGTYNDFIAAGGEFPACFQFGGGTPSNNAWSVLEDVYMTPQPAQFTAIVAFNA